MFRRGVCCEIPRRLGADAGRRAARLRLYRGAGRAVKNRGLQHGNVSILTPELRAEVNRLIGARVSQHEISRRLGMSAATLRSWASKGKIRKYPRRDYAPVSPETTNGRVVHVEGYEKSPGGLANHDVYVSNDLAWLMERLDIYKAHDLCGTREYVLWRERATELLMARAERELEAA